MKKMKTTGKKGSMIKAFPVSTPAYPWDLRDNGTASFLDGAIEHIGVNAVFTPVCYYMEEAAAFWWGGVMPHNKRIHRYFPEDGRFYFKIDPDCYRNTRLIPERTKDPLIGDFDALGELDRETARRGMDLSAWFPVFRNENLARRFPDCTPVDIFGGRQKHGLCPNHPDVIGFFEGVIRNIVRHYKNVKSIGLDKFGYEYWAGGPQGSGWYCQIDGGQQWTGDIDPQFLLLGTPCFCEHCGQAAARWGYDWTRIKTRIEKLAWGCVRRDPAVTYRLSQRGFFKGEPGLARLIVEEEDVYQWLRFKIRTLKEAAVRIRAVLKREAPHVKMGVGLDPSVGSNFQKFRHYGYMTGSSFRDLAEVMDGISGSSGLFPDEKYYLMKVEQDSVEDRCAYRGGDVHAVSPAGADDVRNQIRMFARCGSTAYCIFGYTWAPMENLHAAREELRAIEDRMLAEGKTVARVGGR